MATRKIKLPSFTSITPGGQAILNLPLNLSYDMIRLVYANGTAADITDIQVLADGKVFQRPYGGAAGYDYLNDYYGRTTPAGSTEIWFQRPEMTNVDIERLTSFGTANLNSATIEITIDAGAAANFNVTAYAIVSPPTNSGILTKIKVFPFNAGAGLNDVASIVTGHMGRGVAVPTAISAIHIHKTADDITSIGMNLDAVTFWDQVPTSELELDQQAFGRAPQAQWTVLDFILDGNHLQSIMSSNVKDLRLQPTCTAAGMMNIMVEYYDTLGGVL